MSKKKRYARAPVSIPVSTSLQKSPRISFKHFFAICLMVVVALGAYSNTFHVPFHFDDQPNIMENPNVHIRTFTFDKLEQLVKNTYGYSIRIFSYFTLALNYYFGGLNVFGYHLVNLLIHIASGIILYWLLLLTFNLPSLKKSYGPVAFPIALFSSLLFIAHPIQTQSVTYIVQRMASMAAMFYLLALLLYVKARLLPGEKRFLYFAGAAVSYLLGLFSKENAAILPLFVALYEFYFFQNFDLSQEKRKSILSLIGVVLFIALLMLFFWGKRYFDVVMEGYNIRDFNLTERVLTQFRVVLYYATLLLYPHPSRLNLDYDFLTSRGILDPPTTLLSILTVAGLIGYSLWTAKRRPLVSYWVLWYFGNLVIESSIFPLEMVYEHRLYLPAVGPFVLFSILVVQGWQKIWKRFSLERSVFGGRVQPLWVVLLSITALLSIGSYQRNTIWKDEITLWEDCLKKSPNKPRVHVSLGYHLGKKKPEKALEEYNIALKLNPDFPEAHFNLGCTYLEMNLLDKAISHLERYVRLDPEDPRGYNEIGLVNLQKKNFDEALLFFKKGLQINPRVEKLHANLGNLYFRTGQMDEAMAEYQKALELNPDLTEIYVKMAEVYSRKGSPELATEALRKALKLNPSLYEAHVVLGASYVQEGKLDQAVAELRQALQFNSKDPMVYSNLGVAYRRKGLLKEAVANYKEALALDPSFCDARINLGEIYAGMGMTGEAISEFQYVIRLDPDRAEAHNNLGAILLRGKRLDEAISSLKKALALRPKYGNACFNLALAYYYKKDFPSASDYARKALDLGYDVNPELLKALHLRP